MTNVSIWHFSYKLPRRLEHLHKVYRDSYVLHLISSVAIVFKSFDCFQFMSCMKLKTNCKNMVILCEATLAVRITVSWWSNFTNEGNWLWKINKIKYHIYSFCRIIFGHRLCYLEGKLNKTYLGLHQAIERLYQWAKMVVCCIHNPDLPLIYNCLNLISKLKLFKQIVKQWFIEFGLLSPFGEWLPIIINRVLLHYWGNMQVGTLAVFCWSPNIAWTTLLMKWCHTA